MRLILTEEQRALAETARQFIDDHAPIARTRALRGDPLGFDRALWGKMGELGWLAIPIAEEHGGLGLGYAELALVLEALGRNLTPSPMLSTLLLGAQLIAAAGSDAQRERWLPGVASGESLLAVAGLRPKDSLTAVADGGGFRLTGAAQQVLDAQAADRLVVAAALDGGTALFLIDPAAPGVQLTRQHRIDDRAAAQLNLDAAVDAEAALTLDGAEQVSSVVDRATIGLCAEMLGGAERAFEITLDYLKERHQFGHPSGSFQALQHRAGHMFVELSLARSVVTAAAQAVDAAPETVPAMASLAKARCNDTFNLIAREGVQMHGGVGVTDEYDIGLYLKRAWACAVSFGDSRAHTDRWATLHGY